MADLCELEVGSEADQAVHPHKQHGKGSAGLLASSHGGTPGY